MKNLPDIDRVPLGRSILKNCRANASCVNYYVTLSINLPFFHGHSQVTGSAQSPHPAQAGHTPKAYGTRHQYQKFPEVVKILPDHLKEVDEITTHVFKAEDFQKAFDTLADRNSGAGKVVLTFA